MLGNDIEADNANVFDIFSLSLADRFSSKQYTESGKTGFRI